MGAHTRSTEIGDAFGQGTPGTGQQAWPLLVLRIGSIVSSLLCVVIPLAWDRFVTLFLEQYLSVRRPGPYGSDPADARWSFLLCTSIIVSLTLGAAGTVLATQSGTLSGKTRSRPVEDTSRRSDRRRSTRIAALLCLAAGVVAYPFSIIPIVPLVFLVAAILLVVWSFAGPLDRGWSAILIVVSVLAFVAGALLDALMYLVFILVGL